MNWLEKKERLLIKIEEEPQIRRDCTRLIVSLDTAVLHLHLLTKGEWVSFWFSKEELQTLNIEDLLKECTEGLEAYFKSKETS